MWCYAMRLVSITNAVAITVFMMSHGDKAPGGPVVGWSIVLISWTLAMTFSILVQCAACKTGSHENDK
jgi:hypothetical protein